MIGRYGDSSKAEVTEAIFLLGALIPDTAQTSVTELDGKLFG